MESMILSVYSRGMSHLRQIRAPPKKSHIRFFDKRWVQISTIARNGPFLHPSDHDPRRF